MKYIGIVICFILLIINHEVQAKNAERSYGRFKLDLSTGLTIPLGFLLALEPKYGLNDRMNVGFKIESALMAQNIVAHGEGLIGEALNIASYQITYDYYYFKNIKLRHFVSVGAGIASVEVNTASEELYLTEDTFGIMLRYGYEKRRFKAAIEYNINGYTESHPRNNYLGMKVGFFIGGKRKTTTL